MTRSRTRRAATAAVLLAGFSLAATAPARAAGDGRVVLYFDLSVGGPAGATAAAQALSAQADALVALGPVQVVLADPLPATVLPPTVDPAAVRARLDALGRDLPGAGALEALRRDFADDGATARQDPDAYAELVGDYLDEEEELIGNVEAGLTAWTSAAGGAAATTGPAGAGGGGVFVLVADGFDLDPARFYLRGQGGGRSGGLGGESALQRANRSLAGQLAAGGWRVVALALGEPAPGLTDPAAPLAELAAATAGAVVRDPSRAGRRSGAGVRPAAVRVRLGRTRRRRPSRSPVPRRLLLRRRPRRRPRPRRPHRRYRRHCRPRGGRARPPAGARRRSSCCPPRAPPPASWSPARPAS